jgi:hypothetical protein
VQTVDFFTPVVNDPYWFGQIAAANALSDIYTMGATPITALNLVAYPVCELGTDTLKAILQGGSDKVAEAGAVLLGGHSVEDEEPKYGLAVTGIVHPDQLITNSDAREGDLLVLTKPLGTGVLATALKGDLLSSHEEEDLAAVMAALNALLIMLYSRDYAINMHYNVAITTSQPAEMHLECINAEACLHRLPCIPSHYRSEVKAQGRFTRHIPLGYGLEEPSPSLVLITDLTFFSNFTLGSITIRPHFRQRIRKSIPMRRISHSLVPHGCGFFILTTSPRL